MQKKRFKQQPKRENLYLLKIFIYMNGKCDRVIPWRNVLVDRPATWRKTIQDILRLYPDVHHINQYTGITGRFVQQFSRADLVN